MRLADDLERIAAGMAALRVVHGLMKGRDMGKLSAMADRIRDTKARLEAEADKLGAKLGAKLDGIDKAAPTAFARGHTFLDAQAAEVAEIEDTLRQLSNLPLDAPAGSAASPIVSPVAAPEVPAPKPTFPGAVDPGAAA